MGEPATDLGFAGVTTALGLAGATELEIPAGLATGGGFGGAFGHGKPGGPFGSGGGLEVELPLDPKTLNGAFGIERVSEPTTTPVDTRRSPTEGG